jgi:hypothetical protein
VNGAAHPRAARLNDQVNEFPPGSAKASAVGGGKRFEMALCTRGQMTSDTNALFDTSAAAIPIPGHSASTSLTSKASVFFRTMLVTVSPRFIFVNRCDEVVELCQGTGVCCSMNNVSELLTVA